MPDAEAGDRTAQPAGAIGTRWNPPPKGAFDRFVRRFGVFTHVAAVLGLYALAVVAIGVALAPALWFVFEAWLPQVAAISAPWRYLAIGLGIGIGLFIAGFGLLVAVALLNVMLPTRPRPSSAATTRAPRCPGACTTACSTSRATPCCPTSR